MLSRMIVSSSIRTAGFLSLGAMLYGLIAIDSRAADASLYHDLGDRDGIVRIIDATFVHILADDRIKVAFNDVNIDRLKRKLEDQICVLAGGPCEYTGKDMKTVHKGVHSTVRDFNALVEDLQMGMDEAGISFWTQNRLLALLAPMERDIVTR